MQDLGPSLWGGDRRVRALFNAYTFGRPVQLRDDKCELSPMSDDSDTEDLSNLWPLVFVKDFSDVE